MMWFEPLIILAALAIVSVPFLLHFYNKKHKKGGCSCCNKQTCTECKIKVMNLKKTLDNIANNDELIK